LYYFLFLCVVCCLGSMSTFNCDTMVNECEVSTETIIDIHVGDDVDGCVESKTNMSTVRNPQCPFFFLSDDVFFYDRSDFHSVDNNRFNNHYSSFESSNIQKRSRKTKSKQETKKKTHRDRYIHKTNKTKRQKSRKMDRRFVCIDTVRAENKAAVEALYLS
jgi:hypothetical protein